MADVCCVFIWKPDLACSSWWVPSPSWDMAEAQVWALPEEELTDLFTNLEKDGDRRVSFEESQFGLFSHMITFFQGMSTPLKEPRLSVLHERLSRSTEEQMSPAELPAALDNTLVVPRTGLQHAAITSYGYKLQCLRIQVRQIALERDKARLDLEKAETWCLQLGRELEEQYIALKHTQSKLKDVQAEIEAKELLLQQAVNHQVKLEADTRFLQGKEASLQGKLNHAMKESTQLQNRVTEMAEKLAASEKLVLELQKELNHVVKDKLCQVEPHSPDLPNQNERFAEIVLEYERQCQVLWDQNGMLWRELERLRLQLRESRAERGLPAGEMSLSMEQLQEQLRDLKVQLETKTNYYEQEIELMRRNFERERKISEEGFKAEMRKMEDQKRELEETVAKYWAVIDSLEEQKCVWSLELEERFEMEQARVGQQHTKDIYYLGQQLDQEGEELRTQCRDRESLRSGTVLFLSWRTRRGKKGPGRQSGTAA
ncbi:ninein-like protein isoform x1 [Limosa lapponica baueri]|uniref:Ninein-like protein isoform x1 n=1 Tax=Limosa lapponica baueri TaxID=1758121 RepID=A0A2I0U7H6_LIMLA|nr:ninein-like protein isoform x1 [Limosa lapponica baueri]